MAKIPISLKEGKIAEPKNDELIIGIDLGTTNSLVAFANDNVPKVIKHNEKSALVPSIIYFDPEGQIIVGADAKEKLVSEPSRTIYSAKRLMGKSYNDLSAVQELLAYNIVDTNEEELVRVKVGDTYYSPIDLSAKILGELKRTVEKELDREVKKAVITVPAYFNDAQRQATRDAGKVAGLEVLRIVNEPTAASLAYGIGLDADAERIIAVYDLGGGTFDVSILHLQAGVFEVLSTNGDTFLGGDDFDRAIVDFWIDTFKLDIKDGNKSFIQELRVSAEEAKKALSTKNEFEKEVNGVDLRITKQEFELLIQPMISKTINSCEQALKDAELTTTKIDEIIMVGGSTRVPLVKESVSKFFGKAVNDSINPDEVVALGAAIQADILAGNQKGILLLDITPLSLGIETMGGLMDTIVPRNTKIPSKGNRQYTTSVDGQKNLKITVYQGERDLVEHNRKLAEFILKDIPPMPAGLPKIDISFIIDADGVLRVKAKELRSETETSLEIKSQYGISEEEMATMLMDSIKNAKSDMHARGLLEARNEGNSMIKSLEKFLRDNREFLSSEQTDMVENLHQQLINLVAGDDKNKILDKISEINKVTEPLANEALTRIVSKELISDK